MSTTHTFKICYFIAQLSNCGGTERIVSTKANYLADVADYDVTIVTLNDGNNAPFFSLSPKISIINIDVDFILDAPFKQRLAASKHNNSALKKKLEDVVRHRNFDICICFEYGPMFNFVSGLSDGSVKIAEYHATFKEKRYHLSQARGLEKVAMAIRYFKWRNAAAQYSRFVVLTDSDARHWRKYLKNVEVIRNPCVLDIIPVLEKPAGRCVAIGRLSPEKGFDMLLKIWARVMEKYTGWYLDIYGDGGERFNLEQLIQKLGITQTVRLNGNRPDLAPVYADASILLCTSRFEGFGLALTEAATAGVPIVAYNCKEGPAEIVDDNVSGFLVEPFNEDAFVEKLGLLMDDTALRKRLAAGAIESGKRFKVPAVMEEWEHLFISVTSAGA